jgi:hypothetical protein
MQKRGADKAVLSKTAGWIILIFLVLLDASLDVFFEQGRGLESGIWKPISDFVKIKNPLLMTPFVLVLFYFFVKIGAWVARKIDKVAIKSEELVLTTIVIIYGLFDLWLILVYFFDFTLIKSHYYLIPFFIIIGILYEIWAEKKLKTK